MAVTFTESDVLAIDNFTIDPSPNPTTSSDILIIPCGVSWSAGPYLEQTITSNMGGTWTLEHDTGWAVRRRLRVWVNDNFTTPSNTETLTENSLTAQDFAACCITVSGATIASAYEDAAAGDASGTGWTPTLTAGGSGDGHLVVIQMEDDITITEATGWTKVGQVNAVDGLRSLAVFTYIGTLSDTTPTFSWGATDGYTAWAGYFPAASGTSATATPAAISVAASVPSVSPTVPKNATVTPGALTCTVAVAGGTMSASVAVAASPVLLTSTMPAPAMIGGASIAAATVAGVVSLPPPTLSTGSTIAADTLTVASSITTVAPTTSTPVDATATPSAISLTSSIARGA